MKYEVVVGNIGTVYSGNNMRIAERTYDDYVRISKRAHGRASGEFVILFNDGAITREYLGTMHLETGA